MIDKLLLLICIAFIFGSCSYARQQYNDSIASTYVEAIEVAEDELSQASQPDTEYVETEPESPVEFESVEKGSNTEYDKVEPELEFLQKYRFSFDQNPYQDGNGVIIWWIDSMEPATRLNTGSERSFPLQVLPDGRIYVEEHGFGLAGSVVELTTTQWEEWGIQIFFFGGDITIIGKYGTLTSIPEFHEDDFYFPFIFGDSFTSPGSSWRLNYEFEMQYIMHHEIADSVLIQLLLPDFLSCAPYTNIPSNG